MPKKKVLAVKAPGFRQVQARLYELQVPGQGTAYLRRTGDPLPGNFVVFESGPLGRERPCPPSVLFDVAANRLISGFGCLAGYSNPRGVLVTDLEPKSGSKDGSAGQAIAQVSSPASSQSVRSALVPLVVEVPDRTVVKSRLVVFPSSPIMWAFAEDSEGKSYGEPLRELPTDGRVRLQRGFFAFPTWVDDSGLSTDIGWNESTSYLDGEAVNRVSLAQDGRIEVIAALLGMPLFRSVSPPNWIFSAEGIARRNGATLDAFAKCRGEMLGIDTESATAVSTCEEPSKPTSIVVWRAHSASALSFPTGNLEPSTRDEDRRSQESRLFGRGSMWPLRSQGEGRKGNVRIWIDTSSASIYETNAVVPVEDSKTLLPKRTLVTRQENSREVFLLDFVRGTIEPAFKTIGCDADLVAEERWGSRLLVACRFVNDGFGSLRRERARSPDEGTNFIVDLDRRTFAAVPAMLLRFTGTGTVVGMTSKKGKGTTFVRVDLGR